MGFTLNQLFTTGLIYLTILFGSAYATEKGWLPRAMTHHPVTRILSLGVFAGAICFNGALGLMSEYGSGFLLYFMGASSAFIMSSVLLGPISRIAVSHKLGSLADFFAFRYPAPWVGGLVTVLMLIGLLPLIALQIHAVSVTAHLLNQDLSEDGLAIVFCITMTLFAILFGARHLSTRDKHQGLVVAIGLESVIKLAAFMTLAWYTINVVFDGWDGMNSWLIANREAVGRLQIPLNENSSRTLLLLFFASAVALPHVYHMLLTENDDVRLLRSARWGFPLYMMLISLCIPPVFWGAQKLGLTMPAEFYAIGIGLQTGEHGITLFTFVGSLAAASGVLIVSTLALASMTLNHVILPLYQPNQARDWAGFLLNSRRLLIIGIILASYGMYRFLTTDQTLTSLGIVAFVAVLQFLPGLIGAVYWRKANMTGFLAGLIAGFAIWFGALFYLLMNDIFYSSILISTPLLVEPGAYQPGLFELSEQAWHVAAMTSFSLNLTAFLVFSYLSKPTLDELRAADECLTNSFARPFQGTLEAQSVADIEDSLSRALGQAVSSREISLALAELRFGEDENRPYALNQLRNQMESNLSSTLGQTLAHNIIHQFVPYKSAPEAPRSESLYTIEARLEDFRSQLTGLAAELDGLRRYHRQVLQDLPLAVCTIGEGMTVLTWNHAMEQLTGIPAERIVGSTLISLPEEWHWLLGNFTTSDDNHRIKASVDLHGRQFLLNLHKASIEHIPETRSDTVIVIEDVTEAHLLEAQLLHNERLASIGQLAAGVAHEVGNPVTGIACLAQNLKLDSDAP
ncbi:MAG: PAS domain S-box protein, partial [Pseudomonadales bacterium]|nr:PAS domain S-box protein [Pseudomonadales bacterium]